MSGKYFKYCSRTSVQFITTWHDFTSYSIVFTYVNFHPGFSNLVYMFRCRFSPHWGLEDPSGVQLRLCLCVYVYLSLCLSISMYICLSVWPYVSLFGDHKSVSRNCAQRMQPQATGSNTLSGNIICPSIRPSVHLVVHGNFVIF